MVVRYTIIALAMVAVTSGNAQVKVESKLDSMKILIGGQTNLRVRVTAKNDANVEFPAFEPQQEIAPGIEVVETGGDTIGTGNGTQVFSKIYTLTSWNEGKYEVPAQKVKVDGKTYSTGSIPLTVGTMEVDTTNISLIKPVKDVQDNPFSWSDWIPLFWMSALAVLLLAIVLYLRGRLLKNKPVISRIRFVKKLLPHQKAMKAIEQIKAEQLTRSEDQKAYYTRLTDALRGYLEERFGFNAKEMTSDDIIARLHAEEDKSKIEELRDVFKTADLVKFAKYLAQVNMNDMYLDNVVKFIDDTKLEDVPVVEKAEDGLTDRERRESRDRKVIKVAIAVFSVAAVAIIVYVGWQVCELLG